MVVLAVVGTLRLRLVGESGDGAEVWQSAALEKTVDELGDASFAAEELAALVEEARAAGSQIGLARVDFRGGRGGKASELTVDCLSERSTSG